MHIKILSFPKDNIQSAKIRNIKKCKNLGLALKQIREDVWVSNIAYSSELYGFTGQESFEVTYIPIPGLLPHLNTVRRLYCLRFIFIHYFDLVVEFKNIFLIYKVNY